MIFSFVVVIICRRHSPIMPRSPSPRRQGRYNHHGRYHDGPGFSDTVSNVVEIQRHTHHPHALQYNHRHRIRGTGDNSDQRKPRCNEHKFFHYVQRTLFRVSHPQTDFSISLSFISLEYCEHSILVFTLSPYHRCISILLVLFLLYNYY